MSDGESTGRPGGGGRGRGRGRSGRSGQPRPPQAGGARRPQARPSESAQSGDASATQLDAPVRGARTALTRHAQGLRDDQDRLACRAVIAALRANLAPAANPGEVFDLVEQVQHVLLATRRDDVQLPVALRAAAEFALETPKRAKEVQEALRLLLRWGYVVSADYLPRRARDDARFRTTAVLDTFGEVASEYLPDAAFEQAQRRS